MKEKNSRRIREQNQKRLELVTGLIREREKGVGVGKGGRGKGEQILKACESSVTSVTSRYYVSVIVEITVASRCNRLETMVMMMMMRRMIMMR